MTQNKLALKASDRTGLAATCDFTATADGNTPLATTDPTAPIFDIPNGTQTVTVTMKPRRPVFWDETFSFSVAADGSLTTDVDFRSRVLLTTAANGFLRFTLANVKVSQFRDRTADVLALLSHPPDKRIVQNPKTNAWEEKVVDEVGIHRKVYGIWPPPDWDLKDEPNADFLDPGLPLNSGALNFAKDPLLHMQDVDSVVLERAGVRMVPQLFAVTWPKAIALKENAAPTPFLLYFRQTNKNNGYKEQGIFVGGSLAPYPNNFDYADSGMFESLHYALSPLRSPIPKGVPYQVAEAGADVVAVFPCNKFGDEFMDLKDPEEAETVLQELQAFMFWRGTVAVPPKSIGKTAVAAFSSSNFFLHNWLKDDTKRNGHFLSSVVSAVYFLDPMRDYVDDFVAAALKWAGQGNDKRIRLYMQFAWPSLQKLMDKPLPSPPYVVNSSDNRRTVSVVTNPTWKKAFRLPPSKQLEWVIVHHVVAATMLTHALAQKDF